MPAADIVYSIDSSALIHGWRRVYRPKNFGLVWERLDGLINVKRLRASVEVLNELKKKDDELFAWCRDRREQFIVEIDEDCQIHVARIMKGYPRLVDTVKGRSGADPFVIALAAMSMPLMTVVTEEFPGRERIPDICAAEKIPCFGLADLIEHEDWKFA
jgi:Domain of unknown function (DUF4411)